MCMQHRAVMDQSRLSKSPVAEGCHVLSVERGYDCKVLRLHTVKRGWNWWAPEFQFPGWEKKQASLSLLDFSFFIGKDGIKECWVDQGRFTMMQTRSCISAVSVLLGLIEKQDIYPHQPATLNQSLSPRGRSYLALVGGVLTAPPHLGAYMYQGHIADHAFQTLPVARALCSRWAYVRPCVCGCGCGCGRREQGNTSWEPALFPADTSQLKMESKLGFCLF